jgi:glutaminase
VFIWQKGRATGVNIKLTLSIIQKQIKKIQTTMKKQVLMRVLVLVTLTLSGIYSAYAQNYQAAIDKVYAKQKDAKGGKNADYIKELATVDPNIYGIAIVTADGQVFTKGDLSSRVSIQSISKVFTLAKVIEESGARAVMDKIGVDATGLRFNSIVAIELQKGKEINPLVNPGAIAASSMISGKDSAAKWKNILQTHSDFAGAQLYVNQPVYISEANDNLRNQAIAHLLLAYGRMYFDPVQATDIYTKQCAINVNAKDLAVMAATLATGGINPITHKKVVSPETAAFTMSVMSTAGLYDDSGQWLFAVGLPGKSGVGGGIIAVCPGKFGIAVISPPLNAAGNSVKAQQTIYEIVKELKVNPYLVEPK